VKLTRYWKNRLNPKTDAQRHLCTKLEQLEIDEKAAKTSIEAYSDTERNARQGSLDLFVERKLWFKADDQGRVHTNITNMSRDLRPHLRWNGQRLINVDIVNSQPYFLGTLLLRSTWGIPEQALNSAAQNASLMQNHSISVPQLNPTDTENHYDATNWDRLFPADVASYLRLVIDGRLYEYIQEEGNLEDRARAKNAYYLGMFWKTFQISTPDQMLMRRLFPFVYAFCCNIKRNDYCECARCLQRLESSFVIETVCEHLRTHYPDVFICTIHDSVMTTVDSVDLVESIMREKAAELGLVPKFKRESGAEKAGNCVAVGPASEGIVQAACEPGAVCAV